MALDGRPAHGDRRAPARKAATEDVQIGEEAKAANQGREGKGPGKRPPEPADASTSSKYGAPEKERQLYAQLKDLREEKAKLEKAIPSVMIMAEMKKPRETFVLGRGQYDNPKDKVTANVPAFLPPMAPGLPMNRLGLAKWIVDPRQSAHRARGGESFLAGSISASALSRPRKTSDRRVSSPAIPCCSIGWPRSSCARDGTSRPCSGSS